MCRQLIFFSLKFLMGRRTLEKKCRVKGLNTLTPWIRVLIEKLLVSQLVTIFPYFMKPEGLLPCHNTVHIFSHMNAVHAPHPMFLRSICNIILSSTHVSSKRALSFGVPYQTFECISLIKYYSTCNATFVQVIAEYS